MGNTAFIETVSSCGNILLSLQAFFQSLSNDDCILSETNHQS